ncbi:NAD-binding protein [Halobacterium salinarum]|uniref:NAD-binding protein n=1 Tax=Halobacterium salinarum TaxID=2242 RepID=UPI001F3CCC60|nr:NAD-binding protein [Halobacterium salinarum]MCF2208540.1 NAD-binding protein [Halobacterium salinarum]MCF2241517.1 NAD-binding protein [Halobacterium salinarum]
MPDTTTTADTPTHAPTAVIGGGHTGHEVATRLLAYDSPVTHITTSPPPADTPDSLTVHVVPALDGTALRAVPGDRPHTVVVMCVDDANSLLVAQLARSRLDPTHLIVHINTPSRAPAFERLDADIITTPHALAAATVDSHPAPRASTHHSNENA